MSFPRKRVSAPVEETADVFYWSTRTMLNLARANRDEPLLRRCALRVDGERFNALSDDRQEDLLQLYAGAMAACGAFAP